MQAMKNDILPLGPVRTGKSTLGGLLTQQLGLPQVSLDEIRMPSETCAEILALAGG